MKTKINRRGLLCQGTLNKAHSRYSSTQPELYKFFKRKFKPLPKANYFHTDSCFKPIERITAVNSDTLNLQ